MPCDQCSDLALEIMIRVPSDLQHVIVMVQDAIKSGELEQTNPSGWVQQIVNLDPSGPYEDFLEFNFRCVACSTIFRLAAETYHGSGGKWSF